MSSALRHVLALVLVSTAVVLGGAPACSQQTEGERCDSAKAGDADCESGLTCVAANDLDKVTDRCCPEAGNETDRRCTRGASTSGSGGSSAAGGSAGTSGSGSSEPEAGAAGTPAETSGGNGAGGAG